MAMRENPPNKKTPEGVLKVWAGVEESRTDFDPVFELLDLLVQTYLEKKM